MYCYTRLGQLKTVTSRLSERQDSNLRPFVYQTIARIPAELHSEKCRNISASDNHLYDMFTIIQVNIKFLQENQQREQDLHLRLQVMSLTSGAVYSIPRYYFVPQLDLNQRFCLNCFRNQLLYQTAVLYKSPTGSRVHTCYTNYFEWQTVNVRYHLRVPLASLAL